MCESYKFHENVSTINYFFTEVYILIAYLFMKFLCM